LENSVWKRLLTCRETDKYLIDAKMGYMFKGMYTLSSRVSVVVIVAIIIIIIMIIIIIIIIMTTTCFVVV
jgi:type IV secretory pathway component VirB8